MSIGFHVFYFGSDNSITRVPFNRFDRLFENDSKESFPKYAGKRVKCAMVCVELKNRKPKDIIRIDYMLLYFGPDGKINQKEFQSELRLAMETISFRDFSLPKNVVDLLPKIAKEQYRERFTWTPTEKQVNDLIKMVFKKTEL